MLDNLQLQYATQGLDLLKCLDQARADEPRRVWAPMPGAQMKFMSCPLFEVLMEGPRGGGKTDTLIMDFAQHVGLGFGAEWRGILFRRTFPELQDVVNKTKKWFWQIWPEAKFNEARYYWQWPTGEMLMLRQFLRDDDYWKYHGHAYPWIGWEELCTWPTLSGYTRMFSCCRSTVPGIPRKIRATTNPYGPGHNVVKHRFRLPAWSNAPILDSKDDDGEIEPPRIAIHSTLDENIILMQADPKYKSRIRAAARNEAEKAAWLHGSWDIVAGGMFDDLWDKKIHVVPGFRIPSTWRIDVSFDWGSSKPFSVGWWAKSDGSDITMADGTTRSTVRGDLFRIAEWYGWNNHPNEGLNMLATQISKGIVQRELKWGLHGRVKPGPADSSIWTVQNGNCVATDMEKRVKIAGKEFSGVFFTKADKTDRKARWQQVRQYLFNALPNKDGTPREKPGLFVFAHCDQFIRTVPVIQRDDKDPDDVDTNAEDHILDETGYRVRAEGRGARSGRTKGL